MTTTERPITRQEADSPDWVRARLRSNRARLRRTEHQLALAQLRIDTLQLTRSGLLAAIEQDREFLGS